MFYNISFGLKFLEIQQLHFPNDSLNFTKKLQHTWLLQHITLYQRRQKITSLNSVEFLDTYVCINNPRRRGSGIIIFLYKYNTIASDTLVGFLLGVLCLLFAVRPKRKMPLFPEMWVTRKIFTRAAANLLFLINLIDFFEVYTYRITLTVFFLLKNKESYPLLFKEKKG